MSFHRHARTVSLVTLVSRVTGVARDAALSRTFGAGALMDAFFFAFMIPNLFRRLFGEGALAAAFLPVYTQLDADDPATARRLATLVVGALVSVLGAAVLLLEVVLLVVSSLRAHDSVALWLAMIMLPYMPMVCLVAILGAMLQVRGRFGPTAAAPVVLNACLVAATLGLGVVLAPDTAPDPARARLHHVGGVAAAVLVAGAIQVAWSLLALRRASGGPWWRPDRTDAARAALRRVLTQALPMIVGLGVLQVNTFFDGVIASYPEVVGPTIFGYDYPLQKGAMATVSFAQRLYQFPLGVFGIAVATAIFPALARLAGDDTAFLDTVRRGLRLVLFIGLPASVGLVLVREPLTAVILQGGDFDASDTARVGRVLLGYAPGVWAYSMMHVLTRACYAREDARTPVRVALSVLALNLVLNCALIWTPLRESGLAWSTAFCALVQVVWLTAVVRRKLGAILTRAVATSWAKSVAATLAMAACVIAAARFIPSGDSWTAALVALAVLVTVGAAAFGAGALVLRMPELRWALGAERS